MLAAAHAFSLEGMCQNKPEWSTPWLRPFRPWKSTAIGATWTRWTQFCPGHWPLCLPPGRPVSHHPACRPTWPPTRRSEVSEELFRKKPKHKTLPTSSRCWNRQPHNLSHIRHWIWNVLFNKWSKLGFVKSRMKNSNFVSQKEKKFEIFYFQNKKMEIDHKKPTCFIRALSNFHKREFFFQIGLFRKKKNPTIEMVFFIQKFQVRPILFLKKNFFALALQQIMFLYLQCHSHRSIFWSSATCGWKTVILPQHWSSRNIIDSQFSESKCRKRIFHRRKITTCFSWKHSPPPIDSPDTRWASRSETDTCSKSRSEKPKATIHD